MFSAFWHMGPNHNDFLHILGTLSMYTYENFEDPKMVE